VELPQFKGKSQLFVKWPTPMVKEGHIWISLDRTHEQGLYDSLYIDSNANGRLDDETALATYRTSQYNAYFGPAKVVFEVEDGPVTYHLNLRYYGYSDNRRLYLSSGGWYEGGITLGGAKNRCVLIDYNANGTFDDKSLDADNCDRIRIGEKDRRDTRFVGNYIEVGGVLYRPEIARDGAFVKLAKAEDVKMGNVRLPESIAEFSAGGENGLFIRKPENRIASLPVGRYRINYWTIQRKDEKGSVWKLQGSGFAQKGDFNVAQDTDTELSIGEPVNAALQAGKRDSGWAFSQRLQGGLGESIELTYNGSRPRAPKLNIKNKDGTYDRTFSFQYG
jgi:hypothetical protein